MAHQHEVTVNSGADIGGHRVSRLLDGHPGDVGRAGPAAGQIDRNAGRAQNSLCAPPDGTGVTGPVDEDRSELRLHVSIPQPRMATDYWPAGRTFRLPLDIPVAACSYRQ
jgi:hypothetical protein